MNKIILEMEKLCADILSPANEHDTDIILFGAGRHMHGYVFQFEFVSQFLKKNGAHLSCSFIDRVSAVIDNSPRKQGGVNLSRTRSLQSHLPHRKYEKQQNK